MFLYDTKCYVLISVVSKPHKNTIGTQIMLYFILNTKVYNSPKFGTNRNPQLGVGTKSGQLPKLPREREENGYTLLRAQMMRWDKKRE